MKFCGIWYFLLKNSGFTEHGTLPGILLFHTLPIPSKNSVLPNRPLGCQMNSMKLQDYFKPNWSLIPIFKSKNF